MTTKDLKVFREKPTHSHRETTDTPSQAVPGPQTHIVDPPAVHRPTQRREGLIPLSTLTEPNDLEKAYVLDIIAIHGLNGHPREKWTYRDKEGAGECFWLEELLPGKLPGARIYIYGYDASLMMSASVEDLDS